MAIPKPAVQAIAACAAQSLVWQKYRALKIRGSRGASAVEMLMAIPILLLLGLGGLQASLLLQARLALNLADRKSVV